MVHACIVYRGYVVWQLMLYDSIETDPIQRSVYHYQYGALIYAINVFPVIIMHSW